MARTKKTAAILRALNMKYDDSSDSDDSITSGPDKISDDEVISSDNDGIQNAQETENIADRDHEAEGNGQKPADGDCENESDNDSSSHSVSSEAASSSESKSAVSSSGSLTRKRAIAELDDDEQLFFVEPLKASHKNWEKFERSLEKYQRRTLTVVVVCETMNVNLRNRQIKNMKTYAGMQPSELPLIPEECDPYQRVYICTHGWKSRNRSKGLRPSHRIKRTGCEMRFRAQVMQNTKGEWRVEVKNAYYGHNHEVSKAVYRGYPNVRKVPDDAPIMRDVELMVASGSKPSRVYDYIRTHTPHEVQMQDVYNMFAKLKKCGTHVKCGCSAILPNA